MEPNDQLPVVVIGAGPVGLAAAAHLSGRGLKFLVLEAGDGAGSAMREWGHVRLFSPWRYLVDAAARRILETTGWAASDPERLPTGKEFIADYLAPLAESAALKPHIKWNARVISLGRRGLDKVRTDGRDAEPFELVLATGERVPARAVLDASGTWASPNPIGSGGIPAPGEDAAADLIHYGIPDVLGRNRTDYAGKTVMVVGSGHSAMNSLLDLLRLAEQAPDTRIVWSLRKTPDEKVYGGEAGDALPARGLLGRKVRQAVETGRLKVVAPFRVLALSRSGGTLDVHGDSPGKPNVVGIDRIIAATGFRPDIDMNREVRIDLDPWLEAPRALAAMIDPNVHSCGTVRPHGARELSHPEKDFYILGMKSYGRAPTFLMATGYEQARSVAAMLAGDVEAAARVELQLPETGICSAGPKFSTGAKQEICCAPPTSLKQASKETGIMALEIETVPEKSGCCGGPAPEGVDACCVKDADAKASGEAGCGCGSKNAAGPVEAKPKTASCC